MSGILTIMKKELSRFFSDKRTVAGILLPGVMIYLLYTFMGSAMGSSFGVDEDYTPTVQVVALPASMEALFQQAGLPVSSIDLQGQQAAKDAITAQELDLLVIFPENFDETVAANTFAGDGESAPNIEVFYNSSSTASHTVYMELTQLLDAYEAQLVNKFDINARGAGGDLATEEDSMGSFFGMMMPMLLMIFLYSGCAAVAPESIAGEKERGTIATMLITPIRRSHIAVGKILALAVISLVSAASSTIGTILALPKMMGMEGAGVEMNASIYGIQDYLLLAAVIASTVLLLVTLISILSAFAKTTKEAQTYVVPVMILVMVLGVTGMFGGGASQDLVSYLIPLYNSVQCMTGVFSFSTLTSGVLVTLAVNGVCTIAGVALLAVMFNNEKIIFSR